MRRVRAACIQMSTPTLSEQSIGSALSSAASATSLWAEVAGPAKGLGATGAGAGSDGDLAAAPASVAGRAYAGVDLPRRGCWFSLDGSCPRSRCPLGWT